MNGKRKWRKATQNILLMKKKFNQKKKKKKKENVEKKQLKIYFMVKI